MIVSTPLQIPAHRLPSAWYQNAWMALAWSRSNPRCSVSSAVKALWTSNGCDLKCVYDVSLLDALVPSELREKVLALNGNASRGHTSVYDEVYVLFTQDRIEAGVSKPVEITSVSLDRIDKSVVLLEETLFD